MSDETPFTPDELDEVRRIAVGWRQEPTTPIDSGYAGLMAERFLATLAATPAKAEGLDEAQRDAIREKAIAFGVHDAADLLREWGYVRIADRMRREALARYARLAAGEPE